MSVPHRRPITVVWEPQAVRRRRPGRIWIAAALAVAAMSVAAGLEYAAARRAAEHAHQRPAVSVQPVAGRHRLPDLLPIRTAQPRRLPPDAGTLRPLPLPPRRMRDSRVVAAAYEPPLAWHEPAVDEQSDPELESADVADAQPVQFPARNLRGGVPLPQYNLPSPAVAPARPAPERPFPSPRFPSRPAQEPYVPLPRTVIPPDDYLDSEPLGIPSPDWQEDAAPLALPSQGGPALPVLPSAPPDEARFAFDFKEVPWDWTLKKLAEESRLSLQMTQVPPGEFTYFDQNRYTFVEVLDIVNDHLLPAGFIAIRNGRNLYVLEAKSGIPSNLVPHIELANLPLVGRNEMASVAFPIEYGSPAAAAQEVEGLLSTLGRVTSLSSAQRILVTDVGGNLRRVQQALSPTRDINAQSFSYIHKLRHTPAEEVSRAINDFLASQQYAAAGVNGTPPGARANGADGAAPAPVGPQAVVPEKTTNSLLVRGTPSQVGEIRRLIEQLDRMPAQVLIQALLVEVELGDTDEFGVELGLQDSVLFNRSVIDNIVTVTETVTSPNGVQTTNQKVLTQTSNPGFNFNNQPLGNNTTVKPNVVGKQGLTSLGVGRVNSDLGYGGLVLAAGSESVSVLLRALRQNYKVDVLSRPQIRALDNHEALIQIGRQVPVVDGVAITAVGSANPVIRQDQSGIILRVVPQIGPDGTVKIDVQAEKSAYQLTPGTGVPIFTDAANGNIIEAPVKDITTAATAVSVRTGQTIVLGGMITRDDTFVHRKVPFLSDIPYAGQLFQYKLQDSKRKELLIFLTPTVIEDDCHAEELKIQEMQRLHYPIPTAEEIHGPLTVAPLPPGPQFADGHGPAAPPGAAAGANVAAAPAPASPAAPQPAPVHVPAPAPSQPVVRSSGRYPAWSPSPTAQPAAPPPAGVTPAAAEAPAPAVVPPVIPPKAPPRPLFKPWSPSRFRRG